MSFVPGTGAVQTGVFHRSHRSNDKGAAKAASLRSHVRISWDFKARVRVRPHPGQPRKVGLLGKTALPGVARVGG